MADLQAPREPHPNVRLCVLLPVRPQVVLTTGVLRLLGGRLLRACCPAGCLQHRHKTGRTPRRRLVRSANLRRSKALSPLRDCVCEIAWFWGDFFFMVQRTEHLIFDGPCGLPPIVALTNRGLIDFAYFCVTGVYLCVPHPVCCVSPWVVDAQLFDADVHDWLCGLLRHCFADVCDATLIFRFANKTRCAGDRTWFSPLLCSRTPARSGSRSEKIMLSRRQAQPVYRTILHSLLEGHARVICADLGQHKGLSRRV